jgi:hypothetical protein
VINANKKITLMAGQTSVTLEGGNITFACPGHFTVKGAQHPFSDGVNHRSSNADLPTGNAIVDQFETISSTQLTSTSTSSASTASLFSQKPELYSERLVVWDPITGEALSAAYVLIEDGNIVDKARTANDGFATRRIETSGKKLHALVGPRAPWTVGYHSDEDPPPPVSDNEQDNENENEENV